MKTKSLFKNLALVVMTLMAFSCSKSEDPAGAGGGVAVPTSITVSGNLSTIFVGESVTFTVVNNLGANVTANSELKLNGAMISNPYMFNTSGSYTVTATNGSFTGSTTITVNELPVPTAITLSADNQDFWYDTGSATFTVMDDLGNNLSGVVEYTAEPGVITNPVSFAATGTYNAVATYTLPDNSTLTSNTLVLRAVESTHTTKVLVEDYTGTWCGFCPRLATALENTVALNSNVIPVAIHDDNEMLFPFANQMESAFNVTGFPTGKVNRTITWNESTAQPIGYLDNRQNMGLAMSSSLSGSTITAQVDVHYDLKAGSENRIVVYLLENGLVYNQVNYYNDDPSSPWFGAGDPIVGFVHDHVARTVFTDVFGDAIPAADADTDSTYTANYSLTVPASVQVVNNLELVAFVVGPDDTVLNVQKAALGETKAFD